MTRYHDNFEEDKTLDGPLSKKGFFDAAFTICAAFKGKEPLILPQEGDSEVEYCWQTPLCTELAHNASIKSYPALVEDILTLALAKVATPHNNGELFTHDHTPDLTAESENYGNHILFRIYSKYADTEFPSHQMSYALDEIRRTVLHTGWKLIHPLGSKQFESCMPEFYEESSYLKGIFGINPYIALALDLLDAHAFSDYDDYRAVDPHAIANKDPSQRASRIKPYITLPGTTLKSLREREGMPHVRELS